MATPRTRGPDQPQLIRDWARHWQSADKIVFSRTLTAPRSARTRIEREFDADTVRRLKADCPHDITVSGLAAEAIRLGLVDEFLMIVCPVILGGGKRFFPEGRGSNWNSQRNVVLPTA